METKKDMVVAGQNKPATLRDWLAGDAFRSAVAQALPKHMDSERFVRVALTALMKTPKLRDCTQESVFKAMLDLSSVGLEPDGRRAHLIPYGNTCQLIIDYKGLIELAKRSGEVAFWRAELICQNDDFSWTNGMVDHKIDWRKDRGKAEAVYSHVKRVDGSDDYEVMTLAQVEAIKKRSKAGQSGPWVTDFFEMAKKTVIRRHSKRLTLSPDFREALQIDDDKFADFSEAPQINLMPQAINEPEPIQEVKEQVEAQEPEQPPMPENIESPDFEVEQKPNLANIPMTKKTESNLFDVCMAKKITKPAVDEFIKTRYGIDKRSKLTEAEALDLIEFLNK